MKSLSSTVTTKNQVHKQNEAENRNGKADVRVLCVQYLDNRFPRLISAGGTADFIAARTHNPKLVHIELLVEESNLKVNRVSGRQIDSDFADIEPHVEFLHLHPFQVSDRAIIEPSGDSIFEIDEVLELDVARTIKDDGETAIRRDAVGFDVGGEDTAWEPELGQNIVDGRLDRCW